MTVETMRPAARLLEVQHDGVHVLVDPAHGGAVKAFSWRGSPVFRAAAPGSDNPLEQSCFSLVPFCNRVAFGQFSYAGREAHLPRNWEGDAHTIHGEGWRAPWSVVDSSERHVHLAFAGGSGAWPWPYRAEQRLDVDADGLTIELSAVNTGHEAMPLMLGFHPYFATDPSTRLQARVQRYWTASDLNLATAESEPPPQWRFDSAGGRSLTIVDNCFSGWDGAATLYRSDCTINIRATGCRWLHLYRPPSQDYLCIEPQSAATGALNRGGTEVRTLLPGERAVISMRVSVESC